MTDIFWQTPIYRNDEIAALFDHKICLESDIGIRQIQVSGDSVLVFEQGENPTQVEYRDLKTGEHDSASWFCEVKIDVYGDFTTTLQGGGDWILSYDQSARAPNFKYSDSHTIANSKQKLASSKLLNQYLNVFNNSIYPRVISLGKEAITAKNEILKTLDIRLKEQKVHILKMALFDNNGELENIFDCMIFVTADGRLAYYNCEGLYVPIGIHNLEMPSSEDGLLVYDVPAYSNAYDQIGYTTPNILGGTFDQNRVLPPVSALMVQNIYPTRLYNANELDILRDLLSSLGRETANYTELATNLTSSAEIIISPFIIFPTSKGEVGFVRGLETENPEVLLPSNEANTPPFVLKIDDQELTRRIEAYISSIQDDPD